MFNENFQIIKTAMDVAILRQNIFAQNIANAETPGYKRKYVVFEELLNQAMSMKMKTTDDNHIQTEKSVVKPQIKEEESFFYRNDENGVDLEIEIAQMTANGLKYEVLSRLMSKNIEYYNTVLRSA
ncbi:MULTISPECIES: flagellar basal body rod protein FlgB [Pseudothermotoga]|jgi:flagellar basal-body rod protein FlgB|uniref:flagellar basal body rod protein FlgB n=1 Tax=Pseudothermotoga TaxID=1643951 RepID=UPI0003FBE28D|nr:MULTISPECIES: flagellar basal body rod protein FlgB [Pseudothermotoga]KUK20824.1 MAG: Flagellar basal body rod protein FlgB [Pseudothermotoga lettingae]MDI3494715.1 flagellar basal-body rod protein FlgB [Pseudothermotoga sp.]MDK2885090.1 flagellar basal-body rod protein FlgB [Pseudothermotoga sp.]HBT26342.1 flagellar basal body rod protein FlgB [Pseudothermotoga sp.]